MNGITPKEISSVLHLLRDANTISRGWAYSKVCDEDTRLRNAFMSIDNKLTEAVQILGHAVKKEDLCQ